MTDRKTHGLYVAYQQFAGNKNAKHLLAMRSKRE